MKIRKLWVISQNSYAPYMNAGTRHYGMGRELVKNGIQVRLFSSSFNHKTLSETRRYNWNQLFHQESIDGVEFVWIRTLRYRSNDGIDRVFSMFLFSITAFIVCVFSRRFKKPDAIVGSSPTLVPAYTACILAKLYSVPFVFEIRDLWPQTIVEFHPGRARHPLIRLFFRMEKYCVMNASKIAGLLPGIPIYLKSKYGDAGARPFFWLPNGVISTQLEEEISANHECRRVVYLGALSKANAIQSLLLVAQRCPEFIFDFYGGGTEKEGLIETARSLRLKNVRFHGPIPKYAITEVLKQADILIATLKNSDLYRFGISLNKLYDYMAAGKPVVFGARAFNDPITEANAGVTVGPEDDEAMAKALGKLAEMQPNERVSLGKNGRTFIQKNHSFEVLGNRLLEELQSLEWKR